jgi:hypothetical protein
MFAEIAVALGMGAFQVRQAFLEARLIDIAHGDAVYIREGFLEIGDVLLADQAVPDETDTDTIVGSQDAAVGSRGESRHGAQKTSAGRRRGLHFVWHLFLLSLTPAG